MKWKSQEGVYLAEYQNVNALGEILPNVAGVYAWKLNPISRALVPADYDGILKQLLHVMSLPLGRVESKHLSHSLAIGIEIRGQKLEGDKLDAIREWLKDIDNAAWMIKYLSQIDQHMPALYVGNTNSIVKRVSQHLSETNGFGKRVALHRRLNWRDMTFYWLELPGASKPVLESIEMITQSLSVAAFSERIG